MTKTDEVALSSLPTLTILDKSWEYRAQNQKVLSLVEDFKTLKVDSNLKTAIQQLNDKIHTFITTVFVKGEELYRLVDKRYDGDVMLWMEFVGNIAEQIVRQRQERLDGDLARFKAAA